MKTAIVALLILVLLYQPQLVYAQSAQRIEVSIDQSGSAVVKNLFFIDSTGKSQFLLPVFSPKNVRVFDANGDVPYTIENGLLKANITEQRSDYSLTVEYASDFFTAKTNTTWSFSYLYTNLEGIDDIKFTLVLPQNAQINSFTDRGVVYSDNGILKIDWVIPRNAQSFSIDAEYSFSNTQPPETPTNYYSFLVSGLVGAVAAIIIYLVYKRRKGKIPEKTAEKERHERLEEKGDFSQSQKDIIRTLTHNEKLIVKELFSNKEITQKKLGVKTGIPKATLSRTLKRLETKTIIETRSYGTTRLISLTDWFREK